MRLIDADHAEKVFSELMNLPHDYCGPSDIKISIDAVFSVLGQVPDADPVKHGRWILDENEKIPLYQIKTCSLCGCRVNGTQFNFCPHCGAKMDCKEE